MTPRAKYVGLEKNGFAYDKVFCYQTSMREPPIQSALRYPLNVLGSRANVRVLRELCAHGGDLSVAHLANASRLTLQGVRNALIELQVSHMVGAIGSGRSVLYRLNRTHPLAEALDTLFRAEAERTNSVFGALKMAVDRPEVIAAWVYGSVARGEDQHDSDLDVALVVGDQGSDIVADAVRAQLSQDGARLGFSPSVVVIDMDDVLRLSAGDPWWVNVAAEALAIKGRRPADLVALARRNA